MSAIFSWGRQKEGQCGRDVKHEQTWPEKVDTGSVLWKQISCGGTRSMGISDKGELYAWGLGNMGELGLGYLNTAPAPTKLEKVPERVKWIQVFCGPEYTLAVTEEGELWGWGANESGQLGVGHTKMVDRPTKVLFSGKVVQLSPGANHVLALNEFGEIFSWGGNYCGQLGRKKVEDFAVPGKIDAEVTFKYISAGIYASAAISTKGELYTWGSGGHGRLGHGNTRDFDEPEIVREVKDVQFLQVSFGTNHTLALTESRWAYAWGAGLHGELGSGGRRRQLKPIKIETPEKMMAVYGGYEFSLAISVTGQLYSWGNSANGLCGNGRKVGHVLTPTKVITTLEFTTLSLSKQHCIALGKGTAAPPTREWTTEMENQDPNATKLYSEEDPEKYLYSLYFPLPKADRVRAKKEEGKGEEEGKEKGDVTSQ